MNVAPDDETLPEGLRTPTSVLFSGVSPSLVKWVALALLAPYSSRVYWTDVRPAGEVLDPLDPLAVRAVPEERLHVALPGELQRDEEGARRVESTAATVLRSDEPPESVRRIFEFLRLPPHTQARIAATSSGGAPALLVLSGVQHLRDLYPRESIGRTIRAILDAGACVLLVWGGPAPPDPEVVRGVFDIVLRIEGAGPSSWREATVRCEQGITAGPLGSGEPCRLSVLRAVAKFLETSIPPPSAH